MHEKFLIRVAQSSDHATLLAIWLRAVRATHAFLTEADIDALVPVVRDGALVALDVWVLATPAGDLLGFMGLDGTKLEALFIDPAAAGMGGGSALLARARAMRGSLRVDVNEQNPGALGFYLARGFVVVGRSETDGEGRPFPLLHLAERQ